MLTDLALFFALVKPFLGLFDVAADPAHLTLDCRHVSSVGYPVIEALRALRPRYAMAGEQLRVMHLSKRCKQLFRRASAHKDN